MQEARSELSALYLGLKSDVEKSKKSLSDSSSGFADRVYVKTVFSLVEGVTFRVRQYMISAADAGIYTIDHPSLNFLSETTYKINSQGKIKEKEEYLSFLPGFKFTFKTFAACLEMNEFAERAFSDNGFNQFKLSVDVRNRLTHPRRTQEMMVSRSECEMVQTAEQWFHSLALPLIEAAFERENLPNQ